MRFLFVIMLAAAALAQDPAETILGRGLALAKTGKLDEAERALLEGHRTHPEDPRFALELAGVAYRAHDVGTARRRLEEALRIDPLNSYGNDFLATLFLMEGNLPAALKYWNRIDKPLVQDVRFVPVPDVPRLLRERAFGISGGQVLTLERLETTEASLDRLGLFASYQFALSPRDDERYDLIFRSFDNQQPMRGWIGRILPFARGLPYQTVDIDLYNLARRAINVNALVRWDSNKRRVGGSVSGPVRVNPRLSFRIAVDARDEKWDLPGLPGLTFRKAEAGAELNYGLTGRLQWTSGLWITRRDFQNGDQSRLFVDSWSFELRNGLAYRLWSRPENRVRVDASTLWRAGRVLAGAPSRFAIAEGGLNGTWFPQAKGDDVSVGVRIRGGKTLGGAPFDDLFMLGMERDNDLWMRGHVGTRDGRKGNAPLGSEYALFQNDLDRTVFRLPLVRVQLGPFLDIGRAGGQFGSHGWMEDTGLQAKLKTAGNLTWTIVYGRNLRDGGGVFYTAVSR